MVEQNGSSKCPITQGVFMPRPFSQEEVDSLVRDVMYSPASVLTYKRFNETVSRERLAREFPGAVNFGLSMDEMSKICSRPFWRSLVGLHAQTGIMSIDD